MTKRYNGGEVTIDFAGIRIESGYADGEFLRIEKDTDSITDVVGTDGEVAASETNDNRHTITILLSQTSDANDSLSALAELGLAGAGPLYVRDRNGRSRYEDPRAWVMKPPDVSFDRSATAREWKLRAPNLRRTDGGNSNV